MVHHYIMCCVFIFLESAVWSRDQKISGAPLTFLTDFINERNLDLVLLVKEKDTGWALILTHHPPTHRSQVQQQFKDKTDKKTNDII